MCSNQLYYVQYSTLEYNSGIAARCCSVLPRTPSLQKPLFHFSPAEAGKHSTSTARIHFCSDCVSATVCCRLYVAACIALSSLCPASSLCVAWRRRTRTRDRTTRESEYTGECRTACDVASLFALQSGSARLVVILHYYEHTHCCCQHTHGQLALYGCSYSTRVERSWLYALTALPALARHGPTAV